MNVQPALISIVIRNRNEADFLKFVLESVSLQQLVNTEIIVIDNESEDDSLQLAEKYNCKILTLPKRSFSYGKALNLGIAAAQGEICVLLSAHSMLVGPFALYACFAAFEDSSIAAARFLHVGKRFDVKRWIKPEVLSGIFDVDTVVSKGPLANGCAIRKRVWEEIPFNESVAAAEEKIWALDVLKKGYKIYSPCPTAYCYLKEIPARAQIEKNNRELQTIFTETGVRVGHLKESFRHKVKKFSFEIITTPLGSIRKTIGRAFLEFGLLLRVSKKSKANFPTVKK